MKSFIADTVADKAHALEQLALASDEHTEAEHNANVALCKLYCSQHPNATEMDTIRGLCNYQIVNTEDEAQRVVSDALSNTSELCPNAS